jgi:voltage-gated sodium channel
MWRGATAGAPLRGDQNVQATLERILADRRTERTILALIIVNAVTLGLETVPSVMAAAGPALQALDAAILAIFVAEIAGKLVVQQSRFFRDPWNVFDFAVVAIALVPSSGPLAVLRALRVLRVLRLITLMPSLRRVVGALLGALPGMGSIVLLLGLIYYVASVMATKLFGSSFPEWFGSIPASAYSLFQIMTLESWSMGIVRPVMEIYPQAWMFFVPFILATTFTALNLFIGVVVSAMQEEVSAAGEEAMEKAIERGEAALVEEIQALRAEVTAMRKAFDSARTG